MVYSVLRKIERSRQLRSVSERVYRLNGSKPCPLNVIIALFVTSPLLAVSNVGECSQNVLDVEMILLPLSWRIA